MKCGRNLGQPCILVPTNSGRIVRRWTHPKVHSESMVRFFGGIGLSLITVVFFRLGALQPGFATVQHPDIRINVTNEGYKFNIQNPQCYCWWRKSCTTWDVWNPINNGKNYQPQLVQDFRDPSTVVVFLHCWSENPVSIGSTCNPGSTQFPVTNEGWFPGIFGDGIPYKHVAKSMVGNHQEFQVPKMEGFLDLIAGYFWGGFSPT